MAQYSLKMPSEIHYGEGSLEKIKDILKLNAVEKAVVFTDKGIEKSGILRYPIHEIEKAGVSYTILSDLPPEPTYREAQGFVDMFRKMDASFIIAVGGGSVMDTAKLASVLATGDYGIKELLDNPRLGRKWVKTLMIPTTAGTGAEATPNAIVAVPERELKIGIVNNEMIADYVLLDARMIKSIPRKIAAATGIDALAHAVECWTSKKATPFSDMFALQALDLILNNIMAACNDETAMDAKSSMQLASFYAGVAITASGTTAVHALSYPLGGRFHIAHGVSNAILLAPVMRFNEPFCRSRLAAAYDRCVHENRDCMDEESKSAYIVSWLEDTVRKLDIPTSLKEYGVTQSDIETLVNAGMQVTRLLNNNIRPVTASDARTLYQEII